MARDLELSGSVRRVRSGDSRRNAIHRLVDSPELRRHLAERARELAERHFGVEPFVAGYEALYAEARTRGR